METSIRFVRVGNSRPDKDGKPTFRTLKPALCFRGKQRAHAVINDETAVRVVSDLPLKDHDLSAPVTFNHGPYPLSKLVDHFRKIGARKGITQRADFLLTKALDGGVDEEAELPPDEIGPGLEGADGARTSGAERSHVPGPPKGAPERSRGRPKPAKPPSGAAAAVGGGARTAGSDVIRRIAVELKLEPTKLRKLLRSKGLSAPYTDEKKIRGILGK